MFKSSSPSALSDSQDAIIGKNIKLTGSIDSPDRVILNGQVTGDVQLYGSGNWHRRKIGR